MSCRTLGNNDFSQQLTPRQNSQSLFDWLYQNYRSISRNFVGPAGPAGPAGSTGSTGPAGPAGPAGASGSDGAGGNNMTTERGQIFSPPTLSTAVQLDVIFKQPFAVIPAVVASNEKLPVLTTTVSKTGASFRITGLTTPIGQTFETLTDSSQCTNQLLTLINGRPAVSYYFKNTRTLKLFVASDTKGTEWGEGQTLVTVDTNNDTLPHSLCVLESGEIGLAYYVSSNHSIMYLQSNDTQGIDWPDANQAIIVEQGSTDYDSVVRMNLGDINGVPGVAWTGQKQSSDKILKFATQINYSWQSWLCAIADGSNTMGSSFSNPINVGVINGSIFIATSLTQLNNINRLSVFVQDKNDLTTWTIVSSSVIANYTRMMKRSSTEYIIYKTSQADTMDTMIISMPQPNTWSFGELVPFIKSGTTIPLPSITQRSLSFAVVNGMPAFFGTYSGQPIMGFTYFEPKPVSISYAAFA